MSILKTYKFKAIELSIFFHILFLLIICRASCFILHQSRKNDKRYTFTLVSQINPPDKIGLKNYNKKIDHKPVLVSDNNNKLTSDALEKDKASNNKLFETKEINNVMSYTDKKMEQSASTDTQFTSPITSIVQKVDSSEIALYTSKVSKLIEREKEYPQFARISQIEGLTIITCEVSSDGTIKQTRIKQSSGHKILDNAALKSLNEIGNFPPVPKMLNGKELTITVPVAFYLSDDE